MSAAARLPVLAAVCLSLSGCASTAAIQYASARTEEPHSIHWIEVDTGRVALVAVVAKDQVIGKETPSSMARRNDADAAVNGGFFVVRGPFAGDFDGLFVWKGRILSEPVHRRSSFAFCEDGRVWIEAFDLATTVLVGSSSVEIDGINRRRSKGETVLFTPEFASHTVNEGPELVVDDGRIVALADGGSAIPPGGFVLGLNEPLTGAAPGVEVGLKHRLISRAAGEDVDYQGCSMVSAGPALIREGRILDDYEAESSKFAPSFSRRRHPRTAVGIRKDGALIVVVVDGRQEGLSVGMTLPELSAFLKKKGAREAYNLDGGGSSTMIVGGEVVNSPSDATGERPSSDAVVFRVADDR